MDSESLLTKIACKHDSNNKVSKNDGMIYIDK